MSGLERQSVQGQPASSGRQLRRIHPRLPGVTILVVAAGLWFLWMRHLPFAPPIPIGVSLTAAVQAVRLLNLAIMRFFLNVATTTTATIRYRWDAIGPIEHLLLALSEDDDDDDAVELSVYALVIDFEFNGAPVRLEARMRSKPYFDLTGFTETEIIHARFAPSLALFAAELDDGWLYFFGL